MNPSRATQNPSFRHLHRQGGPKPRQSAEGIVALGDAVDVELPRKGRTRIPTLMLKDIDNMIIIYIYYNMNVLFVVGEILLRMLSWTSENVLLIGCSRNNWGRIMRTTYAYITCVLVYLYLYL
jgi:hypothetical protein